MSKKFDYTALALRFSAKFPVFTYVGTQINFWVIANILLVVIMHLQSMIIDHTFKLQVTGRLGPMILVAIILGISYGVSLGLVDYYLDKRFFRKKSLGKLILFKTILSLGVLIVLLEFVRYVLFDLIISPSFYIPGGTLPRESWRYFFYILLIYYFFMTLVISFISQVNRKYGPGVLVPLLLGRYRNPREEERIFMFMDLKSSTSTAEKLGHLKYSSFIRDCFMDINQVLMPFRAEVYQYVGDEIVVTWREKEGLKDHSCIRFYFACKRQFEDRAGYYMAQYGFLPDFKAGLHTGKVTAVEIGEIKRDIAYHGDTLNTAARIQSVCNEFNRDFLVSEYLLKRTDLHQSIRTEELGMILLRGKTAKIGIVSVDWVEIKV
jgi:adenylate cyclase